MLLVLLGWSNVGVVEIIIWNDRQLLWLLLFTAITSATTSILDYEATNTFS